jgi:shikimate dehydrogenase
MHNRDQSASMLVGLIGHPVAGNPTGRMFEAAFDHHGIDCRYVSMDVEPANVPAAVTGLHVLGFRGFHVTVPHKVAVVPLMARVSPAATLIGAVNVAIREDDGWLGENTDGRGFMESLHTVADPAGLQVTILGAGGAARAVAVELALAGAAAIEIVNRDEGRGRELTAMLGTRTGARASYRSWREPIAVRDDTRVIVNATSIGLNDADAGPRVDFATAPADLLVMDVVMEPPQTRFLREAATAGFRTVDGLGMLINQGALAFRLWTGVEPDRGVLHQALAGSADRRNDAD